MLREEHLLGTMIQMKLGEVLKFKVALASKVGSCSVCLHCIHCHKSSSILNSSDNNDTSSPDDSISNTQKCTSVNNEENTLNVSDVLHVNQKNNETYSNVEAERSNGSHKSTVDNEENAAE